MKKAGTVTMNRPKHTMITRPAGQGSAGRHIPLLTNHFKVSVKSPDVTFYQYSVSIETHDKRIIQNKVIARKILDNLCQIYSSLLSGKKFAFDGESSLYTVGPLPQNNLDFIVVLEDSFAERGSPGESDKRSRRSSKSNSFNVHIVFSARIHLRSVSLAHKGADLEKLQDALRVLDIILRHQAASRGCLLVRQSFFHDDSRNCIDVGGGVTACRGFHSSFRPTQGGLSLNIDVSTTMILTPGPVIEFLKANQNARDFRSIDWGKAKRMLKHMIVRTTHTNWELKIRGLSENPCNQQYFSLKVKNDDGSYEDGQTTEITVYDYFTKHCNIDLTYSAYMPCLDVGKPKRPRYLPVELCSLVCLQRYKKSLSSLQRASLIEKSRQKPQEKLHIVTDARRRYRYDDDPLLAACGISIENQLTKVDGRVLEAPMLKVGNGEDCIPRNGRWNFNNKKFFKPTQIELWAVVNFSARCDTSYLSRELINCGRNKGILINRPHVLIEEDPQYRKASAVMRVEKMFEQILAKLPPGKPPRSQLLLCVLPEKKICDIYGLWKKKCLCDFGFVNQCVAPIKINDQYLTNVLLKINSKLGGFNSLLAIEHPSHIPLISDAPTMIVGMDVSHGPSGHSDIPSIAAVVASQCWPLISRYGASVRSQSPKMEMIESLFEPQGNGSESIDCGVMRELLMDFYNTSNNRKPSQIIVFRDGVSESQFSQVLDMELEQMKQAFQHLDKSNHSPKFTVIVAQKNHHTKLFQANGPENVPPGTVVDSGIVHPKNYDFYMCSQAGMIGTSRPAHYHVLLDEIGFSPDGLQSLIHSLSYVYQRSTTAVSIVAPVYYAHLAAKQMGQCLKPEDLYENSSAEGSLTSAGSVPVPKLPRLHEDVESTMFFC